MQEDAEMREKCPKCGNFIKIGDGRNQCSSVEGDSEPEPSRRGNMRNTGRNFGQHLKRCSGRVQCPGCKRFFQKRSMPNHLRVCVSLNGKGLRKKRRAYQHWWGFTKVWGNKIKAATPFTVLDRRELTGKIGTFSIVAGRNDVA